MYARPLPVVVDYARGDQDAKERCMSRLFGSRDVTSFRWVGSELPLLDTPTVIRSGRVVVGRYGGNRGAGAQSNEDGALVWCASDGGWEFAALLDAHFSAQSAELVIGTLEAERESLTAILAQPAQAALPALQQRVLGLFTAPEFRARCRQVEGEASCLLFARKGAYLWWLAIGDCVGYLFNEELARLGQFAVNQRIFYEWVGQRNTFDLPAPCYSSGTLLLRSGAHTADDDGRPLRMGLADLCQSRRALSPLRRPGQRDGAVGAGGADGARTCAWRGRAR